MSLKLTESILISFQNSYLSNLGEIQYKEKQGNLKFVEVDIRYYQSSYKQELAGKCKSFVKHTNERAKIQMSKLE